MSLARVTQFSISLDGYATGDVQSLEKPFGHAGMRLHTWMFSPEGVAGGRVQHGVDGALAAVGWDGTVGAEIMGRRKFGPRPGRGPTRSGAAGGARTRRSTRRSSCSRTTHAPHSRWRAGRRSTSSTLSPTEALEQARAAAGGLDVRIGGGPTTVREFLEADLVDVMHVVLVPIVLGRGVSLWEGLEGVESRFDIESVTSPSSGVTHLLFQRKGA